MCSLINIINKNKNIFNPNVNYKTTNLSLSPTLPTPHPAGHIHRPLLVPSQYPNLWKTRSVHPLESTRLQQQTRHLITQEQRTSQENKHQEVKFNIPDT